MRMMNCNDKKNEEKFVPPVFLFRALSSRLSEQGRWC